MPRSIRVSPLSNPAHLLCNHARQGVDCGRTAAIDPYELVEVPTRRGISKALLFPRPIHKLRRAGKAVVPPIVQGRLADRSGFPRTISPCPLFRPSGKMAAHDALPTGTRPH